MGKKKKTVQANPHEYPPRDIGRVGKKGREDTNTIGKGEEGVLCIVKRIKRKAKITHTTRDLTPLKLSGVGKDVWRGGTLGGICIQRKKGERKNYLGGEKKEVSTPTPKQTCRGNQK